MSWNHLPHTQHLDILKVLEWGSDTAHTGAGALLSSCREFLHAYWSVKQVIHRSNFIPLHLAFGVSTSHFASLATWVQNRNRPHICNNLHQFTQAKAIGTHLDTLIALYVSSFDGHDGKLRSVPRKFIS